MLASSCVTMTNVTPRLSRQAADQRVELDADVMGSRPADGSSRNRIIGSSAIARAIAARFCMPPGDRGRQVAGELLEADQRELHPADQVHLPRPVEVA